MRDKNLRRSETPSSSSIPLSINTKTYGTTGANGAAGPNEKGNFQAQGDEGVSGVSMPFTTPAVGRTSWIDEGRTPGIGSNSLTKEDLDLANRQSREGYDCREASDQRHSRPLHRPPPAVMRLAPVNPSPLGPQTNQNLSRPIIPTLQPSRPNSILSISRTGQRPQSNQPQARPSSRENRINSSQPSSQEEKEKTRIEALCSAALPPERRNATDISRDSYNETAEERVIRQCDGPIYASPFGTKLAELELGVEGTPHAHTIDANTTKDLGRQLSKVVRVKHIEREVEGKEKEEEVEEDNPLEEGIFRISFKR